MLTEMKKRYNNLRNTDYLICISNDEKKSKQNTPPHNCKHKSQGNNRQDFKCYEVSHSM